MLGTFTLSAPEPCQGCGAEIPAGAVAVVSWDGLIVCSADCARTADEPARERRAEREEVVS